MVCVKNLSSEVFGNRMEREILLLMGCKFRAGFNCETYFSDRESDRPKLVGPELARIDVLQVFGSFWMEVLSRTRLFAGCNGKLFLITEQSSG